MNDPIKNSQNRSVTEKQVSSNQKMIGRHLGFSVMRYMLFSDRFPVPFLDFIKCHICSFHFLCNQEIFFTDDLRVTN